MLLTTAYFPPVAWFALALQNSRPGRESLFYLEANESYRKQSYRNRCYILASDGPQMLQVPIIHGGGEDGKGVPLSGAFARTGSRSDAEERGIPFPSSAQAIQSVRVDYSTPWVVRSERALATAYESSAYFEYYADGLFALLEAQPATLWELNLSLIGWCLERLHVQGRIESTSAFTPEGAEADDYRYVIHPKRGNTVLEDLGLSKPYYQVFRDKLGGFTPGLSILDLLFNEGPGSLEWLIKR